ncbi:hypothetical protein BH09BAC5_BH09BAC5_25720 [soil metagenome]
MEYFVYILRSLKNDSYYKGQTVDLKKRLEQHNSGIVKSTGRYKPWIIEWYSKVNSRTEAILLEKKIKNITSRERIELFIKKHSNADVL